MTSNDVVQVVKRSGFAKVGHAGTLDPMATGVLVIGTDGSTKELTRLLAQDKEYVAYIRFGAATDAADVTGIVTAYGGNIPDLPRLRAAFFAFPAEYDQVPPAYSAIKTNGVRAYDAARKGVNVTLAPRKATIVDREFVSYQDGMAVVRIVVKKGFYVRSFAEDLAKELGTYATLAGLVRTRSGEFTIAKARALSEFGQLLNKDRRAAVTADPFATDLLMAGQLERIDWDKFNSYGLAGPIIKGKQLARQLGYPTANFATAKDCLAGPGVYASVTSYDGLRFKSLTFVGVAFNDQLKEVKFESHLFNFAGDLYGKTIRTELVTFLRANRKFDRVEMLVEQMKEDAASALST